MQNLTHKVLSTFAKHKIKSLLIGGQATILYGAAEFSRDIDFVLLLDKENITNLKSALKELKAKNIYVPPLEIPYLERGHACHFKCETEKLKGFRIDIMTRLRGCSNFNKLWQRKKIIKHPEGFSTNIISLQDLVQSKKTQRDKDWLMIKRLLSVSILKTKDEPNILINWWFCECRTPELLIELAIKYPEKCKKLLKKRPLLKHALKKDTPNLATELFSEENKERIADKKYWAPLQKELETLRHQATKNK